MALLRALAVALGLCAVAEAAPEAPVPEGPAAEAAPAVIAHRSVLFLDRPGDCDPMLARRGRCAEVVDFASLERDSAPRRGMIQALSAMYAELWEDIGYGWWGAELADRLGLALPETRDAMARVAARGRITALPDATDRLDRADWLGSDGWFKPVRDEAPAGQVRVPPTVRLAGRFALRMAYGGRLYEYDVMDADPGSSGPFFEQFFPYRRAREATDGGWPLAAFIWPGDPLQRAREDHAWTEIREQMFEGILYVGGYGDLAGRSANQFEGFYNLVGSRILANSLERYVPTHTRILTALVAMRRPPMRTSELRRTADVVAAASGQTDKPETVEDRFDAATVLRSVDFVLRYDQLPAPVVDTWLARFPEWRYPTPAFLDRLEAIYRDVLSEWLRDERYPLDGLSASQRAAWIRDNALPGRSGDLDLPMRRVALRTLIEDVPRPTRDVWESRILLDHLSESIATTFDPGGEATSPSTVEGGAASQWTATLSTHGLAPSFIDEGLGAVHPLAICTTQDRREALDEPVFRAIHLDLIVDGAAGATRPEELLWRERARLPFVGVDNATVTTPELRELFGLPDGRAMYRVRWTVWTGWHLLWNSVPAELELPTEERMVLRTAAVCDDMVLAPPEVVPTLVRASLLAGDAFPVTPLDGRASRVEREARSNEDLVTSGQSAAEESPDQATTSVDTAQKAAASPAVAVDLAASSLEQSLERGTDAGAPGDLPSRDEALIWLRGIIEAPVRALVADTGSLLLVVLDADATGAAGWDLPARTPYARRDLAGDGLVAGWTWLLGPTGRALVAPGYAPRPSVEADLDRPRWTRPRVGEGIVSADLGFIPERDVRWTCNPDAAGVEAGDTVAGCPPPESGAESQGLSVNTGMTLTWWFHDAPRLALEGGPELRLDMRPRGESWDDADATPVYTWTFRPQLGLSAGVRVGLRPMPLQSRGNVWGAARTDGGSLAARWQVGARGSLTVGPGFAGLEGNAGAELWAARSINRARATHASLHPWWPDLLVGPYGRWQYAFPFGDAEARWLMLDEATLWSVGARVQVGVERTR